MVHRPPRKHEPLLTGTVAHYGPTNELATKLVAAVVDRDSDDPPVDLHRWITHVGDIRHDPCGQPMMRSAVTTSVTP